VSGAFLDLENVQVLLSPQGTLFGRNAAAGAILLQSKRPTDELEGQTEVTVSNYDLRQYNAILNVPVSEHAALRFAGQHTERTGHTHDVTSGLDLDDDDDWFGRASLRVRFDDFENLTIVDSYSSNGQGPGIVLVAARLTTDLQGGRPI